MNKFLMIISLLFSLNSYSSDTSPINESIEISNESETLTINYSRRIDNFDGSITFITPKIRMGSDNYFLSWDSSQLNSAIGFCQILGMEELESFYSRIQYKDLSMIEISASGRFRRTLVGRFFVSEVICG